MIILLFICALTLSAVAAFYGVAGLMAIFAAAPIPVAIMGTTLELSKLVIASWLYRNWKEIPFVLKSYLTIALFILMFLTSMSIFGFLSQAHIDQGLISSDVTDKVALYDQKIQTERDTIASAKTGLQQLDQQINETLNRTADQKSDVAVRRSVNIRKSQTDERKELTKQIETAQNNITKLNEEKAPIAAKLRKVEAEVGPIKYIAAVVYSDKVDTNILEKAVRWVTLMLVAVFDPLAVVLLIAANWSLVHRKKKVKEPVPEKIAQEPLAEILDFQETVSVQDNIETEDVTEEPQIIPDVIPEVVPKRVVNVTDVNWSVPPPPTKEHPVFTPEEKFWRSRPPTK